MSTAQTALEAVWLCMVEIAEQGHDDVVLSQRQADPEAANRIAARAGDLKALACAAAVLARTGSDHGA